jgi:hypothetical protein
MFPFLFRVTSLFSVSRAQYRLYRGIGIACTLIVAAASYSAAQAGIINGDFSVGLDAWQTIGDVGNQSGVALISDATGDYSGLYQPVSTATGGAYQLSFDFRPLLSGDVPNGPFAFADTFFATLYMTDFPSSLCLKENPVSFNDSPGRCGDARAR